MKLTCSYQDKFGGLLLKKLPGWIIMAFDNLRGKENRMDSQNPFSRALFHKKL